MGAWGSGIFDNDAAADWAGEFADADDLTVVDEALDDVLEFEDEYLESDEACQALAACEVIARLKGNRGQRSSYSQGVDDWVQAHPQTPPDEMVRRALAVVDRVRRAPSELMELWEEGDAGPWHVSLDDLRQRVAG